MDEFWWYETDDALQMLQALWRHPIRKIRTLQRQLHFYYLACCREIWDLLPDEDSRRGVRAAERYLDGRMGVDELRHINYYTEGASFALQYRTAPEQIQEWVDDVRTISQNSLRVMLNPPSVVSDFEPYDLLVRAACFADYAMMYSLFKSHGPPSEWHAPFLSARLLRAHVGNPFRSEC
jgi:hypothetical protein